jgi:hypothetical protein
MAAGGWALKRNVDEMKIVRNKKRLPAVADSR